MRLCFCMSFVTDLDKKSDGTGGEAYAVFFIIFDCRYVGKYYEKLKFLSKSANGVKEEFSSSVE